MKMNSDKGGDLKKFKELAEAYDIFSNEDKRKVYDKYGMDGNEEGKAREQIYSMRRKLHCWKL